MLTNENYELYDWVEMKKEHPCGSREWEIIRLGADIKLRCGGCGHIIMLPRTKFNRLAKRIVQKNSTIQ